MAASGSLEGQFFKALNVGRREKQSLSQGLWRDLPGRQIPRLCAVSLVENLPNRARSRDIAGSERRVTTALRF